MVNTINTQVSNNIDASEYEWQDLVVIKFAKGTTDNQIKFHLSNFITALNKNLYSGDSGKCINVGCVPENWHDHEHINLFIQSPNPDKKVTVKEAVQAYRSHIKSNQLIQISYDNKW